MVCFSKLLEVCYQVGNQDETHTEGPQEHMQLPVGQGAQPTSD